MHKLPSSCRYRIFVSACLLIFAADVCFPQNSVLPLDRPALVVQTGHSWEVTTLAFSPDGKTLASGSRDQTVKLWDVATGLELRTLNGRSVIFEVAFSPDSKLIAVNDGGTVQLWDVATGAMLRAIEVEFVNSIAFSPDGKILATGTSNGVIQLWDVLTAAAVRKVGRETSGVFSIAFSKDGKTLVSGSYKGDIKLWSVETDSALAAFKGQYLINSIVFTPNGNILASDEVSGEKIARRWNPVTGAELLPLRILGDVKALALSGNGNIVAAGVSRKLRLWDVVTGTEMAPLQGDADYFEAIVFSSDDKMIATGSPDGTVKLWDLEKRTELRTLKGHSAWVQSVDFNPDGKTLVSGGADGTIRLWDLSSGAEPRTFKTNFIQSVAFSPDGSILASGSSMGTAKLWEVSTGAELRTFKGQSDGSVAFSPDGKIVATAGDSGAVLWDVATGAQLRSLKSHSNSVESVVFSPDGKIVARGTLDHTVALWDVSTGTEFRTFKGHAHDVSTVAFSPDGRTLASGSWDGTVKFWDVSTGVELRTLRGHSGGVLSLAFSPDGKMLATGSEDLNVKLWDVTTGMELASLVGHSGHVSTVAFSRNGKYLVSGGRDSVIKIWDVSSRKELATLIAFDTGDWLAVAPDGLFDGTPAAWSKILWRFNNNTFDNGPVESYFNDFFYPSLLTEILAGKHPNAPAELSKKNRKQPRLQVTVVGAHPNVSVTTRQVKVRIEIAEAFSGAQDLRLFRNGSLVKVWRGDLLKGRASVTLEAPVSIVAGANRLTSYAFNRDNIKSRDATVIVNGADRLKRNGIAYVVAVGVNEYANSEYDLKYAVADARDFAEELKHQQSNLKIYEKVELIQLIDRNATKAKIIERLRHLSQKIQPEDALVIYFAGHGTAQRKRFYLIPHDLGYNGSRTQINRVGLQNILAHSISDEELEKLLELIDAGRIILVIDACNSGQALEAEEKRRGPMNSKGLAQLAYEKGMYILTAAQSYQAAIEAVRLGHGYLTYALVEEGLKTNAADRAPKDGRVLLQEWLDFATARVPQMQEEKINEQRREGRSTNLVIKFAEGDTEQDRNLQRPRVFYRREAEAVPLVVRRATNLSPN